MKRVDNLYAKICTIDNLKLADYNASKGKSTQPGVIAHNKNKEQNIIELSRCLLDGEYRTSRYATFTIFEPKERLIFKLPYFPDRIVHHAIMIYLEEVFVRMFTADTYSCIKGRGIMGAANAIKEALEDETGTSYCLKLDIKKFYPSVNHSILKRLLRRKVKDYRLLCLLDEIIDSAEGLPIGNYLSQYLANFYLTGFDHWIKEVKKVKYYFRYADDLVILSDNKEFLHKLLEDIKEYLYNELRLTVKNNYQVFPVEVRGIDFVGYVFRRRYTRLRKSIKKNFCRMVAKNFNIKSIVSYNGWLAHCNGRHLTKKILGNERVQKFWNKNNSKNFRWRQIANEKGIGQADCRA